MGEHGGIDGEGVVKAVIDAARGRTRGGSGIAQQLAKNAITGAEYSLARKVEEGALAIRMTRAFPRERIIEAYLANVWFGRGVTGAAAAPLAWFGKPWSEVSDAEAITLIVMLRGPARYDPLSHPDRVKRMRDDLAKRMHRAGKLSRQRLDDVLATEVSAVVPAGTGAATWVGMAAAHDMATRPAASEVTTTISAEWQEIAAASLRDRVGKMASAGKPGGLNGAIVVMSVRDGSVLASVGGVGEAGFDRTFAMRQPGSAAKPFFYLAALDQGLSPYDLVRNDAFRRGAWRPRNANGKETGPAPLYAGLEQSSNLMTLHLSDMVSMDVMFSVAEASGAWPEGGLFRGPVSMLGASETSLRSLVSGYAGIMAGGRTRASSSIRGHDAGDYVFASQRGAEDVVRMMRGVVTRGTAAGAMRGMDVAIAGKTGTTQDGRDGIFIGMTPSVVVGVWVGRDDNRVPAPPMRGNGIPARIARDVFESAAASGLIDRSGALPEDGEFPGWPPEPFPRDGGGHVPALGGDEGYSEPSFPGDDPFVSQDPLGEALARAFAQSDVSAQSPGAIVTHDSGLFVVRDPNADLWGE